MSGVAYAHGSATFTDLSLHIQDVVADLRADLVEEIHHEITKQGTPFKTGTLAWSWKTGFAIEGKAPEITQHDSYPSRIKLDYLRDWKTFSKTFYLYNQQEYAVKINDRYGEYIEGAIERSINNVQSRNA